jgi:subtilisin family serine protease
MKFVLLTLLIVLIFSQFEIVDKELIQHFENKNTNAQVLITLKEQIDLEKLIYNGKSLFQYNADERADIILEVFTKNSLNTQKEIISELKEGKYEYSVLWIINGILVKNADKRLIEKISLRKNIKQISLDKEYIMEEIEEKSKQMVPILPKNNETVEYNIKWVKAPEVWKMGFDGKGMVVGVGDTGLNHRHESIIRAYRGTKVNENGEFEFDHNYNWYDPSRTREPSDTNGHGTHCSGTVAGGKGINRKIGVAPGAQLIHCRALVTIAAQIQCMQWWIAPTNLNNENPQTSKRPHVVSHSYNNWQCSPRCDEDYKKATEAVIAAGIQVVNSAGNRGPRCGSINPNSRFPVQLSIASLQKDRNDISSFSSRGPNPLNATILKPELSAPGENVVSAQARSNNGYVAMSGTSMSTPNVAGGVALLWSAVPKLVRDVKKTNEILQKSSLGQTSTVCDPKGTPNGVFGYGTVDYEKAVKLAQNLFK